MSQSGKQSTPQLSTTGLVVEAHGRADFAETIRWLWRKAEDSLRQEDIKSAEIHLQQILQLSPADPYVHFYLGQIEFGRSDWRRAIFYFKKCIQADPTVWQVNYFLGVSLWNTRDYASSTYYFDQSARLIPSFIESAAKLKLAFSIRAAALTQEVSPALWSETLTYLEEALNPKEQVDFLRSLCAFERGSPKAHNEHIFEKIAIPLIRSALSRNDFGHALDLHNISFIAVGLLPHTQDQWAWCFDRLNPLFVSAGEKFRHTLPDLLVPDTSESLPIVTFIVDYAISMGSGLEMLMLLLEAVSQTRSPGITPVVYTVLAAPPILSERCKVWGIRLVDFDQQRGCPYASDDLASRFVAIRERSVQDRAAVALFFSTYEGFVSLASSIGFAPIQIYLTMGFHSLTAPRINAYLACASLIKSGKTIRNQWWRTLPIPFPNPFPSKLTREDFDLQEEVSAIRGKLLNKYDIILGTLARPEKLDAKFIGALAQLLKAYPRAVFLWFGNSSPPEYVSDIFSFHGIDSQCLFMGWVNTKVFSRVLDIHLDSFDLPTGLTMAETFWAGTAYVIKRGVENENIGLASMLASIIDSQEDSSQDIVKARAIFQDESTKENLMMLTNDIEEYVSQASRLIQDGNFRSKVGRAAKQFMSAFFKDSRRQGIALGEHIYEVIGDAKAKEINIEAYLFESGQSGKHN